MELEFYKYQGTGNDFILIDNRRGIFDASDTALVKKLCDRRFGIGADGFMLLESDPAYDMVMVYYNSDGNQSSMCGNGGRCIVKFAHDIGAIGKSTTFMAIDGAHDAYIQDDQVFLKIIDVSHIEHIGDDLYMNTGSPHYVRFVDALDELDVFEEGRKIRYNDRFSAEGTNVNFVKLLPDGSIQVRTYERGVEDETYSCGTGVTAAAIGASLKGYESPVKVKTLGGNLMVTFRKHGDVYGEVYLSGPAVRVYKGTVVL